MQTVACLAEFYNIDLQLKDYNCTCQQIGLQGRVQEPQFIKQRLFKGLKLSPSVTGSFHLFQWLSYHVLPWTGDRFCEVSDHANNLPWNCNDTLGWRAELNAELCSSCLVLGTELFKSFSSFLLLFSRVDNSYHLFPFQTSLSPYSGLHSKGNLLRMKWATWAL